MNYNVLNYSIGLWVGLIISSLSCTKKLDRAITFPNSVKNVKIHQEEFTAGPCEPSIFVSPLDSKNVLAGSVLDNVYLSNDGGHTWKVNTLSSEYGVYGDPVTLIDYKGNYYFAHLANPSGMAYSAEDFLDRIVVQKSIDQGKTWNGGTYPKGDFKKDHDKHWLTAAPNTGAILMTWTEFDKYGSKEKKDRSRILFSQSKDEGSTWTVPKAISQYEGDCIDDDQTTEGAVPAVHPNGSYYVVWGYDEKIYLDKSTDAGMTWLQNDIYVNDQIGGWSYDIPGISRCNGMPILCIDQGKSKHSGNIYVNFSDQRNGKDDTDIWFCKSEDEGKTWSRVSRVNDDSPGKHQFLSWMTVDNSTGHIYIVYYDRRNYIDANTDVYLAYSTDGGNTFVNKRISDSPFLCQTMVFFGDYNNISANNGVVRPIWTRQDGMKLSVWTAIIDLK